MKQKPFKKGVTIVLGGWFLDQTVENPPTSTLTSIGRLNWVRFSGRGHPR